jgi:enoyl-CoA hydratase/carnithine racemase
MAEPAVRVERDGPVTVLTMARPECGNALDAPMLAALGHEFGALATDAGTRAVVLTGSGKAFSVGGALADFEAALAGTPEEAAAYCRRLTDALAVVVHAVRALPCPVVAAVNGQAAGAGFALALACDVRLAGERAAFNIAYGALGASTDGGMSWLLPRVVSPARALELLLDQPIIRPAQALREGIVSEVVPADALRDRAMVRARDYARNARHSVAAAKRMIQLAAGTTFAAHLEVEHAEFVAGVTTADMRAAVRARRDGTAPRF